MLETQKPTAALDGVDGAEDRSQKLLARRVSLQAHQVPIHVIQVFRAFNEKILKDVVHRVGGVCLLHRACKGKLEAGVREVVRNRRKDWKRFKKPAQHGAGLVYSLAFSSEGLSELTSWRGKRCPFISAIFFPRLLGPNCRPRNS